MRKATSIGILFLVAALSLAFGVDNLLAQEGCVVPTFLSGVTYPVGWHPIAVSGVTVAPSGEVDLDVNFGGQPCPPYTWVLVSGNGFSLEDTTTAVGANTLIADASACGSATIRVTDNCLNSATGFVRSTIGVWAPAGSGVCVLPGVSAEFIRRDIDIYSFSGTYGMYRQHQALRLQWTGGCEYHPAGTYCPPYQGESCDTCMDIILSFFPVPTSYIPCQYVEYGWPGYCAGLHTYGLGFDIWTCP